MLQLEFFGLVTGFVGLWSSSGFGSLGGDLPRGQHQASGRLAAQGLGL